MAAPIQKVAKFAFQAFSRHATGKGNVSQESILQLASAMNQITSKDVCLNEGIVHRPTTDSTTPVTYIHIFEDKIFSMGIFIMRQGGRLPLHNHPGMYGVLKPIHGRMKIDIFTEVVPKQLPVQLEDKLSPAQKDLITSVIHRPEKYVTSDDECSILVPQDDNYHEIKAVDGPAAFLDILSPPYDYETRRRICHYFEELPLQLQGNQTQSGENMKWLVEIEEPPDYKCDLAEYEGPRVGNDE